MTWTLLHDACERHRVDEIRRLVLRVRSEPPSSRDDDDGSTIQLRSTDDHSSTPLHVLCWQGNPDCTAVQAIMDACPEAASDKDYHGNTPLHAACSSPNVTKHLVRTLLDAFPSAASTANREGLCPLHMACRYAPRNEGVIGLLIEAYPDALRSRIKMGNSPVPTKRKKGDDALLLLYGSKDIGHALFDPNARMPVKDSVGLRNQGSSEQVRDGAYPLHIAVQNKASLAVLEMLIKYEPGILYETNKFGETPLHLALKGRQSLDEEEDDATKLLLLRCGPEAVNSRDKNGNLPLHVGAMSGCCSEHVAKMLLGAWPETIHQTNGDGLTPMDLAVQYCKCSENVLLLFSITDYEDLSY